MTKHEKILSLLTKPYTLLDGKFHCTPCPVAGRSVGRGAASAIQGFLKGRPRLYQFLVTAFSPVLVSRVMRQSLAQLLAGYGPDAVVVNLGSGPLGVPDRPDIVNLDISPLDRVDICADAMDLPFPDDSVDCLLNLAMLEHVPDPAAVVAEMRRILKPGGRFFCFVPFCQPLHAAPHDFTRWTRDGAGRLFAGLTVTRAGVGAGPTSGWLWITVEWLSLLLSCGSPTVKDLLALGLMLLLFPLKHLDRLLERHPGADRIASGFFLTGHKGPSCPRETP